MAGPPVPRRFFGRPALRPEGSCPQAGSRARARAGSALAAVGIALACASPAPESPAPLLWTARGPDRGVLHLLGSVHAGAGALELGDAAQRAYADADELVVEVDLTRIEPAALTEVTLRHGMLAPGERLADRVSPETWALLAEVLGEKGVPVRAVDAMEPWMAALTVIALEFEAVGIDQDEGVDRQLLQRADRAAKPIRQLESAESQIELLDGLSPELQELMLLDALLRRDRIGEETTRMIDAWQRGDEAALASAIFSPLAEDPGMAALYQRLFFDRNEAMSERLSELARDGKTRLVVLGAGHMIGERGIPALLAERGFEVERVR